MNRPWMPAGATREETGVALDDLSIVGLYFGSADGILRITFSATVTAAELRSTESQFAAEILESCSFDRNNPCPSSHARTREADDRRGDGRHAGTGHRPQRCRHRVTLRWLG